jgi:hypothetical protein
MHYPIFKAIVNTIDTQLSQRNIRSKKFKTWEDNKINAIGLELIIDVNDSTQYIQDISINFDWDSFRETTVAKDLKGMSGHPFLKIDQLRKSSIKPTIDIELAWNFKVDHCQPESLDRSGNNRIQRASEWMEAISKEINRLLQSDNIITRWHIEIEGDEHGRYLSAINLISYFQYELSDLTDMNQIQHYVSRRLQDLLLKANRVIKECELVLNKSLAA